MKIAAFALLGTLALSACDIPVTGGGYSHVMDITNSTGVTMTHFYASTTGQDTWGPDQLGSSVLGSGEFMTIDFEDGSGSCYYDFRAKFADGDVVTNSDIDVCAETSWNYY